VAGELSNYCIYNVHVVTQSYTLIGNQMAFLVWPILIYGVYGLVEIIRNQRRTRGILIAVSSFATVLFNLPIEKI
jgi:hypothetical protein